MSTVTNNTIFLDHKMIFIIPTKQGGIFAFMLLFMLMGSINYNNNLSYLLTFLLLTISLISIIHVYRNLYALKFCCGKCSPVFAGEHAELMICLENDRAIDRYEISIKQPDHKNKNITSIKGNEKKIVCMPVATKKRGYLKISEISVQSSFPLGLFVAKSSINSSAQCLVYPKPIDTQLPLPEHTGSGTKGISIKTGTDDFLGFKNTQPTDPPRHIHWKAYAKGQPLMTKQFGTQIDEHIWINWDQTATNNIEEKISLLTTWVLEAEAKQLTYGLILPDQTFEPDSGAKHRHRCLKALALVT
jgi:uncharacterized protein (DUF58 family)